MICLHMKPRAEGKLPLPRKAGIPAFLIVYHTPCIKVYIKLFKIKKIYAQSRPNKNKSDFHLDINGAPWYNNFSGLAGFGSTRRPWNF